MQFEGNPINHALLQWGVLNVGLTTKSSCINKNSAGSGVIAHGSQGLGALACGQRG